MAKRIYVITGEASGDFLGAQLVKKIRQIQPNTEIMGIGGPLLIAEGLKSLFPMQDLSVIGIFEILPKIFKITRRIFQTVKDILEKKPDVIVTIDSSGFCLAVAKRVKKKSTIPIVHYVAPTVWAWRSGRAKKIAKRVDHLLTLFPFEPPYFTKYGLPTTFVGHPLTVQDMMIDPLFTEKHHISKDVPVLVLLPGSRPSEIKKLLPIFVETINKLLVIRPTMQVILPTLPFLLDLIKPYLKNLNILPIITTTASDKYSAFHIADVALAASGTIALELAMAELPMVIAYKVSLLTYFLGKFLIKTPFACLVNILLQKSVVPEKLQYDCNAEQLTTEILNILQGQGEVTKQELKKVIHYLNNPQHLDPSETAAKIVLNY